MNEFSDGQSSTKVRKFDNFHFNHAASSEYQIPKGQPISFPIFRSPFPQKSYLYELIPNIQHSFKMNP